MVPPVVSLIGRPNCGKTTLLEKLIPVLVARGCRVGTIKHHVHHEFQMDLPGKDTWRHRQAGAAVVALSSPAGLGVIRDTCRDTPLAELVAHYFSDVDLVLTEGYKKAAAPKIEVFRSSLYSQPLEPDPTLIAMVSDVAVRPELPRFAADDISELADFLIMRFLAGGRSLPATGAFLVLTMDGVPVPLSAAAQARLRQLVLENIRPLVGASSTAEICLRLDGIDLEPADD